MDISFESTRRVLYCRSSEPNGGGWMSGTVSIVWLRKKVCLVDPLGCLFGWVGGVGWLVACEEEARSRTWMVVRGVDRILE